MRVQESPDAGPEVHSHGGCWKQRALASLCPGSLGAGGGPRIGPANRTRSGKETPSMTKGDICRFAFMLAMFAALLFEGTASVNWRGIA